MSDIVVLPGDRIAWPPRLPMQMLAPGTVYDRVPDGFDGWWLWSETGLLPSDPDVEPHHVAPSVLAEMADDARGRVCGWWPCKKPADVAFPSRESALDAYADAVERLFVGAT